MELNNTTENVIVTSGRLFDDMNARLHEIYIYPFVLVICYMVIGLIGNLAVIYIFTWQWKPNKTTMFILTLAGVDLVSCLFNMPVEAAILWNPLDFDHVVLCKISRFTSFIASASSSFVLIAISVDRYVMVCRPFLGRELGVRYAKRTCVVAVLLGIISTWPSLIFYGTFTYRINIQQDIDNANTTQNNISGSIQVEGKTCFMSNFYVEHYKLPSGFYFFLFGGHAIMFAILTMMYILIGRSLFMSTNTGVSDAKRHSMKYFGLSMMSAITGSIPNTPCENRDNRSVGSRSSRAVSLENINRIEQSPCMQFNDKFPFPRLSAETQVSVIMDNVDDTPDTSNNTTDGNKVTIDYHQGDDKASDTSGDQLIETKFEDNKQNGLSDVTATQNDIGVRETKNANVSTAQQDTLTNKRRCHLNFNLDANRNNHIGKEFHHRVDRFSSESTNSDKCLTPMTPMSPDSVRGILLRSQSVESRARLNRIISDELTHTEVKECSLRRNTLMLRMVTIAFIISFLPYLVIVTLRYANTDIPLKLSKAEQIVYHVFLRTYFINSMINPFIYGFMNEEFRLKLRNLFCKLCTRNNVKM